MLDLPSSGEIILPDAYQRVELVGATLNNNYAGPYIETGENITERSQMEDYEIYITALIYQPRTVYKGLNNPLIAWGSNAGLYFGSSFVETNKIRVGFGANDDWSFDESVQYGVKHSFHVYWADGQAVAECDGQTCARSYIEATGSYHLRIGTGTFGNNQHCGDFEIYDDIKIYKNKALIHDYVPCYKKSSGQIGFYDVVMSEFKTNAGTNHFIKGADV